MKIAKPMKPLMEMETIIVDCIHRAELARADCAPNSKPRFYFDGKIQAFYEMKAYLERMATGPIQRVIEIEEAKE